jgi:hypothetical protein
MADLRSLVIKNGTTQNISNSDTLIVGNKVDAAATQALSVGADNATGITIGKAGVTTTFPGPVRLDGDVTTVAGTTFTTDATFEGDVTFGDADSDTVSFVAKVDSNIVFTGSPATYFIKNIADPVDNQDVATKAYVDAADNLAVTSVGASAPLSSSGGTTPSISFPTWPANASGALTNDGSGVLTWVEDQGGTVTSVDVSGGTTGLTTSGGPVTTSGTITLGGTLAVGNGGTGTSTAFTAGSIVFAGASGVYSQDNANLFWDDANDRLGIATATPSSALSIAEKFRVDSNGRLLEYNDAAPADGQVLIGDTAAGYWKAATLTAGSGVSISNGAGVITIEATGLGGTVTSVDVSGGTTGLTTSGGPVTGSGTITLDGTLGAANGGTGQSSYTAGDLLYASGSTTLSKLAVGTANTVLRSDGSAPAWGQVALTTDVTGTLPVGNGGTGAATLTAGSLIVGNGTSAVSEVAPGSNGDVLTVAAGAWVSQALPTPTDYSVVSLTTSEDANSAVTVAGALAKADALSTARVAGAVAATNSVKVLGIVTFIADGAISAGDPVYLSAANAGQVTATPPSADGHVIAELGIATANAAGGTVAVLWQPKAVVVL